MRAKVLDPRRRAEALFQIKPLKSLRFRRKLRVCGVVLAWGTVEFKLGLRLTGKSDGVSRSPGR